MNRNGYSGGRNCGTQRAAGVPTQYGNMPTGAMSSSSLGVNVGSNNGRAICRNGSFSSMQQQKPNGFISPRPQQSYCGYQRPTSNSRMRQQVGRCRPGMITSSGYGVQQVQQQPLMLSQAQALQRKLMEQQNQMQMQRAAGKPSTGAASNLYNDTGCQPVMVNISAATLASAKNTPAIADRGESSMDGNPNVKYIPLNWEDIMGKAGPSGMRVSMVPSGDPGNPNRQLKIAFGGPGCPQADTSGETPLKIVSFQPVSSGRVDTTCPPSGPGAGFNKAAQAMNFTVGGQQQAAIQQRNCGCGRCR